MTDHCAPQIALMSTEADAHITFLEKSLLQLNRRQGLGFLVAKTVIDNGKPPGLQRKCTKWIVKWKCTKLDPFVTDMLIY